MLSAKNLSAFIKENLNVSVLVNDELKQADIDSLQAELTNSPYVKRLTFISKEQALEETSKDLGTDPTEFLGYNPFTPSFEINVNEPYANNDSLSKIVAELDLREEIVGVDYDKETLESVNDNIRKISAVLLVIACLFLYISFALINNTVRLTIFSKRFLINTMKLVGASWGFIRRPFLLRNLWIGMLAAAIADAILLASAYTLVNYEPQLIDIITPSTLLTVMMTVFVFGVTITSMCAYFSINKYLRMKASTLYYI
jgi:cell division transport system permease protein